MEGFAKTSPNLWEEFDGRPSYNCALKLVHVFKRTLAILTILKNFSCPAAAPAAGDGAAAAAPAKKEEKKEESEEEDDDMGFGLFD